MFRRKIVSTLLIMTMVICMMPAGLKVLAAETTWDGTAVTGWYTGNEAATDYNISTAAQLAGLAQLVNSKTTDFEGKKITLTENIDLSKKQWTPIGIGMSASFKGTFNGNSHKISGLAIGTSETANSTIQYAGLFGSTQYAVIKSLSIDAAIYSSYYNDAEGSWVGGLAGFCSKSEIEDCTVEGSVTYKGTASAIGGIAGVIEVTSVKNCSAGTVVTVDCKEGVSAGGFAGVINGGVVESCYSWGEVKSKSPRIKIGGFVGYIKSGTVKSCYAKGNVTDFGQLHTGKYSDDDSDIGGFAGENRGAILSSVAIGTVSAMGSDIPYPCNIGGFVGFNYGYSKSDDICIIQNCYASGNVDTNGNFTYVGGLVGNNENNSYIKNCYSTGSVTGGNISVIGGLIGILENASDVANCYSTGNLIGGSGNKVRIGGFSGLIRNGKPYNVYWNTDALQSLNGSSRSGDQKLGAGGDIAPSNTGTGMKLNDMKSSAFAAALSIYAHSDNSCIGWKQLSGKNGSLPYLDGIGDAPKFSFSASVGSTAFTAKIDAIADSGNTLAYIVSSSSASRPNMGDDLFADAPGAAVYTSGDNIPGAAAGKHIVVYEINSENKVLKYSDVTLTTDDVSFIANDKSSNVSYDLSECTLPLNVTAVYAGVSALQQGSSAYNVAKHLIDSQDSTYMAQNLIVYDFKLLNQNHEEISGFSGKVAVKIPIPSGMSGNLHVYWYNPKDDTVTDMDAKQENGYLVFETTHFSFYAIAKLSAKSTSGPGTTPNPDTSSSSFPFLPAILLGINVCGLVAIKKKFKIKKLSR